MTSTLIIAIVTVAGTFGFMYFQRKRLHTRMQHMQAGLVAQRLGLQLVEGNPEFNLAIESVRPDVRNVSSAGGLVKQVAKTQLGGTLGEFRLRMVGDRAELVLYCKQDYSKGFVEDTTTTWWDLRLTTTARVALAPFEVRLRKEATGLECHRGDDAPRMPVQTFGDPALDARYVVEAHAPDVPARIARALASLPPYLLYVHVACRGNAVSFVMTPQAVLCSALNLEQILQALTGIAAALEGRAIAA